MVEEPVVHFYKEFQSKFKAFKGITGYKNTTKDGDPKFKALYYCKSILKVDERLVMRWDGKHAREYFIVAPSQLAELVKSNFHLYETLFDNTVKVGKVTQLLHNNCTGKVFFDIDGKPAIGKTFEQHIQETKANILTQFPGAVFQISGSKTDTKYSYHIVLSNYKYDTYSTYISKMKEFAKCYPVFDSSVYSSIRHMKCINQSKGYTKDRKPDDRVQKYIEGSETLSKHLITCDFDENCFKFENLDFSDYCAVRLEDDPEKRLERIQRRKQGIDISNIKPFKGILPMDFSYFNANALEKLQVLPSQTNQRLSHDIIIKVMWWCKHHQSLISFEDFWLWNSTKDNSQERKDRYRSYWNGKQYYVDNKFLDNLLELYYPKIKSKYPLHRYKRYVGGIDKLVKKTIPHGQYLSYKDIDPNCKTDIMAVGCGVGKTKAAIDYVKQNPMNSVLIIVPRITLGYDMCERFKQDGLDLANYKESNTPIFGNRHQLVSASSLFKLDDEMVYNTIICDEFETMIDQFMSPEIHGHNGFNLFDNWNKLKSLMRNADKVLLLDAITTMKSINFVNKLEIGPYNLIDNKKKVDRSIITVKKKSGEFAMQTEQRFFELILQDLKKGLKCFVFMPYKTGRKEHCVAAKECIRGVLPLTKFICDKLGFEDNKDIVGYYAENYEAKKRLKHVNTIWNNLKCVITNTTTAVGINYELLDFDKIYIYHSDFVNPRDVIQVSKRLRYVKDTKMTMYSEPPKKALFEENILVQNDCPVFTQLKKDVLLERECYSLDSLYYLFERNSIELTTEIVSEDFGDESLVKFEDSDDYCIRYQTLKDITQAEYELLLKDYEGGRINLYQKLEIEKYLFKLNNSKNHPSESVLRAMWTYRFYINTFNTLLNKNFVYNEFLAKNGINVFDDDFVEFPVDGCVPHNFDIKRLTILNDFRFKKIDKNTGQDTYAKVITSLFGLASFTMVKNCGVPQKISINGKQYNSYATDDMVPKTMELYKMHNNEYHNSTNLPECIV